MMMMISWRYCRLNEPVIRKAKAVLSCTRGNRSGNNDNHDDDYEVDDEVDDLVDYDYYEDDEEDNDDDIEDTFTAKNIMIMNGHIDDDDHLLSCFCFQLDVPLATTIVWMFCGMKHWCAISVLFAFIIVKFLWWAVITQDQIFAIILLPTKYNVSINRPFQENTKTSFAPKGALYLVNTYTSYSQF